MKHMKRGLSLLLAIVMVFAGMNFSGWSATVWAEEEEQEGAQTYELAFMDADEEVFDDTYYLPYGRYNEFSVVAVTDSNEDGETEITKYPLSDLVLYKAIYEGDELIEYRAISDADEFEITETDTENVFYISNCMRYEGYGIGLRDEYEVDTILPIFIYSEAEIKFYVDGEEISEIEANIGNGFSYVCELDSDDEITIGETSFQLYDSETEDFIEDYSAYLSIVDSEISILKKQATRLDITVQLSCGEENWEITSSVCITRPEAVEAIQFYPENEDWEYVGAGETLCIVPANDDIEYSIFAIAGTYGYGANGEKKFFEASNESNADNEIVNYLYPRYAVVGDELVFAPNGDDVDAEFIVAHFDDASTVTGETVLTTTSEAHWNTPIYVRYKDEENNYQIAEIWWCQKDAGSIENRNDVICVDDDWDSYQGYSGYLVSELEYEMNDIDYWRNGEIVVANGPTMQVVLDRLASYMKANPTYPDQYVIITQNYSIDDQEAYDYAHAKQYVSVGDAGNLIKGICFVCKAYEYYQEIKDNNENSLGVVQVKWAKATDGSVIYYIDPYHMYGGDSDSPIITKSAGKITEGALNDFTDENQCAVVLTGSPMTRPDDTDNGFILSNYDLLVAEKNEDGTYKTTSDGNHLIKYNDKEYELMSWYSMPNEFPIMHIDTTTEVNLYGSFISDLGDAEANVYLKYGDTVKCYINGHKYTSDEIASDVGKTVEKSGSYTHWALGSVDYNYKALLGKLEKETNYSADSECDITGADSNMNIDALYDQIVGTGDAARSANAGMLNPSEKAAFENGSAITVALDVKGVTEDQMDNVTLIDAVKDAATPGADIQYLNIDLLYRVGYQGDAAQHNIEETTSDIAITLDVDDELLGKLKSGNCVVYRYHDGAMEELPVTLNETAKTVTFNTNKFSDYALVSDVKTSLSGATVTITDADSFSYDGTAKVPTVTVEIADVTVEADQYEVTYTNSNTNDEAGNVCAGTVSVTVTAKENSNYSGSKTADQTFIIAKGIPDIGEVTCSNETLYDSMTPDQVVLARSKTDIPGTLELTEDALLSTKTSYNWKFTPTDTVNYDEKTGAITLAVVKNELDELLVSGTLNKSAYIYGDSFSIAGLTFKAKYKDGTENDVTDSVVFDSTLAVGQTSVIVSYTIAEITKDTTVSNITVSGKPITDATVTLGTPLTYNGTEQTQAITSVKLGDEDVTYTVSGNKNTNAGTYTLTITGNGNYSGTVTKSYTISKASLTPTVSGTIVKNYDGNVFVAGATSNTLAIALTGLVEADEADVTATAGRFVFASANASDSATVNASGITLNGDKATNYTLSQTDANAIVGKINKATPTITLGNLSQKSNSISAVTATLTPASDDATVTVEYRYLKTPAVEAVEGHACKYGEEGSYNHVAGCPLAEAEPEEGAACDCGFGEGHDAHNASCGYVEAVLAQEAVYEWKAIVPTAAGSYLVRAYLTETNAGNNLIGVGTVDEPAATGTLVITQYVAPTPQPQPESKPETKPESAPATTVVPEVEPATPTVPVEETKVEAVEVPKSDVPVAQPKKTPATTIVETTTPEAEPVVVLETEELTIKVAESEEKTVVIATIDAASEEAWESIEDVITDSIETAEESDLAVEVVIELNEVKEVPATVIESIAGKNVDLTFDLGEGISWTINGNDVVGVSFESINLAVTKDAGDIPEALVTEVSGDNEIVTISLAHDGAFGFTATLTIAIDKKDAGKYANLFYYNEETGALEFMCAALISEEGDADLTFVHASDYVIVVADEPVAIAENSDFAVNNIGNIADNYKNDTVAEVMLDNGPASYVIWLILALAVALVVILGVLIFFSKKKNA